MQEEFHSSRRSNLIFVFLIIVNLFLLTARLTNYVVVLKNFLYYVVNPVPKVADSILVSSYDVLKNIRDIIFIHQENAKLKNVLKKYSFLETDYENLLKENSELKQILDMPVPYRHRMVLARVVNREAASWFEWIGINKGLEDGLYVDSPVFAWIDGKIVVLGRVWEVYNNTSKIILITNNLSSLPSQVKGLNEDGLIEGQNSHILRMDYLLPGSRIQIGDEVVTSSVSSVFPPGVTIGHVREYVPPTKYDTLRSAKVVPAYCKDTLKRVAILIPDSRRKIQQ